MWEGAQWSLSVKKGRALAPRAAFPDQTVTAARAALSPSGFPWNSQQRAKNAGQRSSGAGLVPAKPRRGSSRYGQIGAVGRSGNLSHRGLLLCVEK